MASNESWEDTPAAVGGEPREITRQNLSEEQLAASLASLNEDAGTKWSDAVSSAISPEDSRFDRSTILFSILLAAFATAIFVGGVIYKFL